MTDNGYRHQLEAKSNEELLSILKTNKDGLPEEALADAENILLERGIEFDEHFNSSTKIEVEKELVEEEPIDYSKLERKTLYMPFIIGLIMGISNIYSVTAQLDFEIDLVLAGIKMIIASLWLNSLAKELNRSVLTWTILGLIFTGWALMVFNIMIGFTYFIQYEDENKEPEIS